MRDIKFRAWCDYNKEMYTPCIDEDGQSFSMDNDGIRENLPQDSVMQYVGLKDKHGKEIFEGDILRHDKSDENNFIMYWCSNDLGWKIKFCNIWYDRSYREYSSYVFSEKFKVIGNKFENPELLRNNK